MADEPTQDPGQTQDTPGTESAPQDSTGHAPSAEETPSIPEGYIPEDRYKNLQADHTRAAQEAAEYRELLDRVRMGDPEVLDILGLDLSDDTPDTPDMEAEPFVTREEWEAYQQALQHQAAEVEQEQQLLQQQQADIDAIGQGLQAIEGRIGRKLTDEEIGFLVPRADVNRTDTGQPDVDSAWQAFEALSQQQIKQFVEGKKSAVRVPDGQSAAEQQFDLSTPEGRQAYGEQRLRELEDSQTLA